MTGFNHILAGCIIAVVAPAPIAPLLALGSHYVLDMTPHFGRHPQIKPYTKEFIYWLVGDGLLCIAGLMFALSLFPQDQWWIIIICAFIAAAPDLLWLVEGKLKFLDSYSKFAARIQWGERPWGWTLEILYGIIFCFILIYLSY